MDVQVGNGPDSWGIWFPSDPKQMPWTRFLDEIVEADYIATELGPYGYLPTDIPTLKAELGKRGLKLPATFIINDFEDQEAWPAIESESLKLGEILAAFDAQFFCPIDGFYTDLHTGEPRRPKTLNDDQWKQLIETINRLAAMMREKFGLTLAFHPHADTHVETEEQIERFLDDTDPELVQICLDTGHHAYCGGDAVAFMRRHHKRIPYLHIKNADQEAIDQVRKENIPFAKASQLGMFRDMTKGAVDLPGLRKVMEEVGYSGWVMVEQDLYPLESFDEALVIAKQTRAYLREIGIG